MRAEIDPDFSEMLACLYRGLTEDQPWRSFLDALAKWMDASFATIIIAAKGKNRPATILTPGANEESTASYTDNLFADDPFSGLPDGMVTDYGEFMENLPAGAATEYREAMRASGFDIVLGIDLRFPDRFEARFRITRHNSLPEFDKRERARLHKLVTHLRIALELFERIQFARAEQGLFQSAAEGLGLAVVVLDLTMRIVSSNPLADHLLRASEGVQRHGDRLEFAMAEHQKTVIDLLNGPMESLQNAPSQNRFKVIRPIHGDLIVTARPLDLDAIHAGIGALALFFVRPSREKIVDYDALRNLLGLTMAEARLVGALAKGATLVETSRTLGISHNTAKVHLRSVFAKTGVSRQAQLVALLASMSS